MKKVRCILCRRMNMEKHMIPAYEVVNPEMLVHRRDISEDEALKIVRNGAICNGCWVIHHKKK